LAESRTTTIAEALNDLGDIELEGMARFFGGSEHVTPEEFVQYVGYLARNPILRAWGWAPAVSKAEAERFTAEARAAGHAKFTIWQQGRDGKRNAAAVRAWRYPLQYTVCGACEQAMRGYDLGSEPRYRAVLEEAAETGLTAAVEAITPLAESGNMREVLAVRPVFRGGNRAHLQGYVLAILRVQTLLEAGGRDDVTCMELSVLDLAGRSEPLGTTGRTAGQTAKAFSLTRPVFVFGNVFAVTAYADEGFYRVNPARAAWMTLLTGCC